MPAPQSKTDQEVEYETRIAARPETVFQFFCDPAKMVQWMGTEATLDPRPGGVCRVDPASHAVMSGEFVEVDPPRRIVFTWGWETELASTPPQSTIVEVTLTPEGDGTLLRLVHRRLRPEAVAFHRTGWDHYLPRLALIAAGRDPGPDPWLDLSVLVTQLRARAET
jgi:uncharacterized protein YndB with AHSA1/START domain